MHGTAIVTRRTFLADLGRGAGALMILGVAGCAPSGGEPTASPGTVGPGLTPTPAPTRGGDATAGPTGGGGGPGAGFAWERVNLGFVSAYVLFRSGEAAIVDTGVEGSADAIEASLGAVGLGWDAVGHVILTHRHGDHIGSLEEVLARAAAAAAYAGAEDIPAIPSPRELTAVADGDDVMGLRVVATPGHTPGHISVFDPEGGILVAGDALNTSNGQVLGANPQFSSDMAAANASVQKIAALAFESLLVGHGDPIEGGASDLVAALAAAG